MAREKRGRNACSTLLIVDAQSVKNTDTAGQKGYDAGKKVSGITLEDYYTYQKALFLDMVFCSKALSIWSMFRYHWHGNASVLT